MKLPQNRKCNAFQILALFAILVFSCSSAAASADCTPTEGWQSDTPEAQGMHSQKLADMMAVIKKNGYNIDLVVQERRHRQGWHIQTDSISKIYV